MQILAVSTAVHYFSSIFHQTDLGEKVFSNEKKKSQCLFNYRYFNIPIQISGILL